MYIINIFENGVDGIKVNYPQNANDSIKKVIFLIRSENFSWLSCFLNFILVYVRVFIIPIDISI